jgi:hypothetical protein
VANPVELSLLLGYVLSRAALRRLVSGMADGSCTASANDTQRELYEDFEVGRDRPLSFAPMGG